MTDVERRPHLEPITASSWLPPAIEPIFDPEQPDRAFLHFTDIPEGEEQDLTAHVASRYFTHFAFELWNAGQTGGEYLTRQTDVEKRGIWLYASPTSRANLTDQVTELIRRYDASRNPDDEYVENRVTFILQEVHRELAKHALQAKSDN